MLFLEANCTKLYTYSNVITLKILSILLVLVRLEPNAEVRARTSRAMSNLRATNVPLKVCIDAFFQVDTVHKHSRKYPTMQTRFKDIN